MMTSFMLSLALVVFAPSVVASGPPTLTVTGRLVYDPYPETKSVRAYLGDDLRLEGREVPLVLSPSAKVPRATLVAAAGTTVTLRCHMRAAAVPSEYESYPIGPDGQPLPRPARCVVTHLAR